MSPWLIAICVFVGYKYYKSKYAVGSSSLEFKPESIAVLLNVLCVITGLAYLTTGNSTVRYISVCSSIAASTYIVYTNYGYPKLSRQSFRAPLQDWFVKCMSGAEFPFLFFTLMFLNETGPIFPFGLAEYVAVALVVRRCVWFLGTHGSKAWVSNPVWSKYGNVVWGFVKAREVTVLEVCNLAEVFLGFWFILLLVTPSRRLMTSFVYWTYLRIRYMAPRSRPGHVVAWAQVDRLSKPLRTKVPLVEKPVQWVVRWFNQGM